MYNALNKEVFVVHDIYEVELTLLRDMLGTNPCNPQVLDVHILDRQRKLIAEKSQINSQVNKYLAQIPISNEKAEKEKELLFAKLEHLMGIELSAEDKEKVLKGELESLLETFKELDLKGTTVFLMNPQTKMPCIGDHMIYGFLKAAAEAIGRTLPSRKAEVLHSISYTQSLINQHIRIREQFISFNRDIRKNEDGSIHYAQRSLRAMTAQGPRVTLAKSEVVPAGAKLKFHLNVMANSKITKDTLKTLFSYGEFTGLGQWRNAGNGMFSYELKQQLREVEAQ